MQVIKLHGLLWSASKKDIIDFLVGINVTEDNINLVVDEKGKRTGQAFVQLETPEDVENALKLDKAPMGERFVRIFQTSYEQFEKYVSGSDVCLLEWNEPVVRLTGLPTNCTERDIDTFFDKLKIEDILMVLDGNGRFTGEAFVQLINMIQAHIALKKNKQLMGYSSINIFRSSLNKMNFYRTNINVIKLKVLFDEAKAYAYGVGKQNWNVDGRHTPNEVSTSGETTSYRSPNYSSTPYQRSSNKSSNLTDNNADSDLSQCMSSNVDINKTNASAYRSPNYSSTPYQRSSNKSSNLTDDNADYDLSQCMLSNVDINKTNASAYQRSSNKSSNLTDNNADSDLSQCMSSNVDINKTNASEMAINQFNQLPSIGLGDDNNSKSNSNEIQTSSNSADNNNINRQNYVGMTLSEFMSANFNYCSNNASMTKTNHVVKIRGLTFRNTKEEIIKFFAPLIPAHVSILHSTHNNKYTVEGEVCFNTHQDALEAMKYNGKYIRHRYLKLFLQSIDDTAEQQWQ